MLFMPKFAYLALKPNGEQVEGTALGPNHLDVVRELQNVGYKIQKIWLQPPYLPRITLLAYLQAAPLDELALLTRQLGMFFSSGLGILAGLESISEQDFSRYTKAAIKDVASSLKEGNSLSSSMAIHPSTFNAIYVQLVHAGEQSGALDKILGNLADYLERELLLKKKMQAALAYPAMIFSFSVGILAFLILFIFPMFVSFFNGLNIELPAVTQSLLYFSDISRHPVFLLIIFVIAPLALWIAVQQASRRRGLLNLVDEAKLKFPLVGPLYHHVLLTRFAKTLGVLLQAGIPQISALDHVGKVLGNIALEEGVQRAAQRVKNDGSSLAEGLSEEELFPKLLVSLIAVGEEVGNLPRVLDLAAQNFDLEVDGSVSKLTVVIEPLMLGALGLFVGYILLAVFLPVYSLLDGL